MHTYFSNNPELSLLNTSSEQCDASKNQKKTNFLIFEIY